MMMMMIRLMVDFGPFFVDSATRKCGLKDHGVDLRTYGKVDLRTFCGLSIFFVDSMTFCVDLRTTLLYYLYHPYIIHSNCFDRQFYCT